MSSLEIAELTGKRHDHVLRDARAMLVELYGEGGVPKFGATHTDTQNGQTYPVLVLPKTETLILVTGYSVRMRAKIIDRLAALEAAAAQQVDTTAALRDPATLRMLLLDYNERVLTLEQTVQEQAPKVVYAEALLGADDDMLISDAAKALGLPIMKTYAALRDKHVLNADRLPAARFVEAGYFRVRLSPARNGRVYSAPTITTRGIEFLRRFADRHIRKKSNLVAAGDQARLL